MIMMSMNEVKHTTSNGYFRDCVKVENLLHDFAEGHDLYMYANYCYPFHEMRIFVSPKKYWAWQRDFLNDVMDIIRRINIRDADILPCVNWDTKMLTMFEVDLKKVSSTSSGIQGAFLAIKKRLVEKYNLKEDDDMGPNITGSFYEALIMAEPAYEEKHDYTRHFTYSRYPEIDKVIYNDPATIVFWKDGTKTVAKAQDCVFDPAVGLAMCFIKKTIGLKEFFKHLPEESEESP